MAQEYDPDWNVDQWSKAIHNWAREKGFYTPNGTFHVSGSHAAQIMLIVTELAEAVEEDRKGNPREFREELVDALIRLLDMMGFLKMDIGILLRQVMSANELRATKHGKKY